MDSAARARLFVEHDQLQQRLKKLENFILSERFEELDDLDKNDLRDQLRHMRAYFLVLARRTSRLCTNT